MQNPGAIGEHEGHVAADLLQHYGHIALHLAPVMEPNLAYQIKDYNPGPFPLEYCLSLHISTLSGACLI